MDFILSEQPWLGEIRPSQDSRFAQFDTMAHGVRAAVKQILAYHTHHGVNTIGGIIDKWAPPTENNTSAYRDFVCKYCNTQAADTFNFTDAGIFAKLIRAMSIEENGHDQSATFITDADILSGVTEAITAS